MGPQIKQIFHSNDFLQLLSPVEQEAWKSFVAVVKFF